MNLLTKIKLKLFPYLMSSQDLINQLKSKGVKVGKGTDFFYPHTITIDLQRPWMLEIGEYCKITGGTIILAHDYSRSVIRRCENKIVGEAKRTVIGNNVFIGMNSIILMGVTVGDNSIVGAGSVLSGSYPPGSVIAGNPAKVICTTKQYTEKRMSLYVEEGIEYAASFYRAYHRMPQADEMGPFFTLFMDRSINSLKENNINLRWSGDEEEEILDSFLHSEPVFESYEKFIEIVKSKVK